MMAPIATENNKAKCVFWDEKDSIFELDLVCVNVGKYTGYIPHAAFGKWSNT
jgi:hypothetical protein